jgi:hypothetical protein
MDFDAEVRSNIQDVLDSVARSSMAELTLDAAHMRTSSSSSQQQVPSSSRYTDYCQCTQIAYMQRRDAIYQLK